MNLARPTTPLRWPLLAAFAASAAFVLPATAGATDYCVAPNTTCGGTNVSTFEQAIDLADDADDSDRILLGDTTYTAPIASGYLYNRPTGPVEILGDGRANTVLTGPNGAAGAVLRLFAAPGSSIHDVRIHLPQSAASGFKGLFTDTLAERVTVDEDATQSHQRDGVILQNGGTLSDSTVQLAFDGDSTAVLFDVGGATVKGSNLAATDAVRASEGGTIERSRLTALSTGVDAARGTTFVTSSLVRVTKGSGVGLGTVTQAGAKPVIDADGVTLIGPGTADSAGVDADTLVFPNESTEIDITNSLIRGFGHALHVLTTGSGTGLIKATYSDYDPSNDVASGAKASFVEDHVSNVGDAGFANPATGDFHLLPGSPLIDAGDPATAAGLDLDGNSLLIDGNGDGIARRDMGAFELQSSSAGVAPHPTPDTQVPVISSFTKHGRTFRFKLSEAARVSLTIQRMKRNRASKVVSLKKSAAQGSNAIRLSRKRALRAGRYRTTLVAVDAAGNRSKPARIRFRIR